MTTDVVGLRFVNEGLDESLRGLQRYEQSVGRTARGMKVVADQSNQNAKSLDRLNRDVLRAENEMRRLAQAMQRGSVTGAQFQGEVNRIAARLRNLGLDRAQAETMRFARAQADLARETQQAGAAIAQQGARIQTAMRGQAEATMFASRAQNASGMAMQQVGYQVGDFLVQVQSGTNALVAFGQQATQLVGVLPMFGSILGVSGTALIGLSAGLGIAIPLVTAIGATIMRARETTGDAAEAFKGLGASLDALDNVRLDNLNKGIAEGAREAAREYERVLSLMERVELRALQSILQGQSNVVEEMIKSQRTLQGLAARSGVEFSFDVMGLDTFNEAVFLAAQLRTLTGETREELLQQVTAIEEALTLRGLMNPQVEALIAKLAEEVGLVNAATDAVQRQNEARRAGADVFTSHVTAYREEQIAAAEAVAARQAALLEENTRFEEEQARKRAEIRRQQAEEDAALQKAMDRQVADQQAALLEENSRFEEEQARKRAVAQAEIAEAQRQVAINAAQTYQTNEAYVQSLAEAFRTMENLREEIGDAAYEALRLAGVDMASGIDAAARNAAILAGNLGVSLERAMGIMRLKAQIGQPEEVIFDPRDPRYDPIAAEMARNKPGTVSPFDPSRLPKLPGGGRSGGGGGGGGAAREQEDYLKNLLLEAQHKQRLVGLTEEQTRRQELLFDLEKRKLPIDEERIAMIVATESYTRSLMEAEEQRMQMMQTVEGHIENAFMSFVDGSATVEEAFKGMLRNILLAVYQQEVAKPAASAVSTLFRGLFGFANGGAFNKGVEFFANGGVVGSPTMFQHSGGLGVMGEAGPEAIMPLKRGRDGKLGVQMEGASGGNVTVNQYFQLSANGDESVRRIVRQEAPRMAEMAKSAVVDAKRRGGSYGRSF